MRLRSILNVPAHDLRKLSKINSLKADLKVFDIEDGVPLKLKAEARLNAASFWSKIFFLHD